MAITAPPFSDSDDSENDLSNGFCCYPCKNSSCYEIGSEPIGETPPCTLSNEALRLLNHTCKGLLNGDGDGEPVMEGLCKQLRSLRSVVPHSSPDSCVIKDALEYREQLKRQIEELQNGIALTQQAAARSTSQVEVIAKDGGLEIHISCQKRPGLMVALMEAIEGLGLVFEIVNLSCHNDITLDIYSKQARSESRESFAEADEIRRELLQTITWSCNIEQH